MIYATAVRLAGGQGHEHIASLQWRNPSNGNTGTNTTAQIVEWITAGNDARVQAPRGYADARIGVVRPVNHAPYLRTFADGTWTNNLLELPRY